MMRRVAAPMALCSAVLCAVAPFIVQAASPTQARPRAGKVEIFPKADLKPGMKATAWTVFSGTVPEPVPVEIIGVWKNQNGPKQDIILAKLGGKAARTNVAGGMSGSPVYIDGKLVGAIALRMSVFSPDAICGITPIENMLEIKDYDTSRPPDAKVPGATQARNSLQVPSGLLAQAVAAGASPNLPAHVPIMVPIETPINFSGFRSQTLEEFGPLFRQLGLVAVQGGASGALDSPKPAADWKTSLQPGDVVTGVLVSGDKSVTGLGTVTYNDGHHILAFGHPFFNLGPVDMPMSKGEILMTLSSAYQPNKFGNATEIVGALKQDRHSGIMGELGATADMVPVDLKVRSFSDNNTVLKQRNFHFNVFVNQKWTPYLMMLTLFDSIEGLNDFAEESTYRMNAQVELDGHQRLSVSTMLAPGEMPVPAPMVLAGWWGDKFNKLYLNPVQNPKLKSVRATVDLLPQRRIATIENAWIANSEVEPGTELPIKVFLRPYRGERIERDFRIKLPAGLSKGDHRILLSDAGTLDRMQSSIALQNRYIDIPEMVSLINQERSNDQLYVSLVENRPTIYSEDKTLPSLPASVLNVMETGRTGNRPFISSPHSVEQEMAIPFDFVVSGSYSLKITVK